MKQKCEYCEHMIDDTDELCPNCGAPNAHVKRTGTKIPKTIEELKQFCVDKDLPLEKMHFHIGEDYKKPKAFGIYKDEKTENFVVYKNKANGERAIRYEGKDEAYAVNEIYQKMKEETLEEREYKAEKARIARRQSNAKTSKATGKILKWFIIIYGILIAIYVITVILVAIFSQDSGYYRYNDKLYYYRSGSWYYYDDVGNDWYRDYDVDDELSDNYENYYESSYYDSSYGGYDYEDSSSYYDNYYDTDNNYDDDWDDDDWDSGSDWDSGYDSDWDSDW